MLSPQNSLCRLATLFLVLTGVAAAEGFSTYEGVAFIDSAVTACSAADPQSVVDYTKLHSPPFQCDALDAAMIERARQSAEYRALANRLDEAWRSMAVDEQISQCQALLAAKCVVTP